MATKELALFALTAQAAEWTAPNDARIGTLNYKAMTDAITKVKKAAPASVTFALPMLKIPTTSDSGLDSIILATMQGYQDDVVRSIRAAANNADTMTLTADDTSLDATIKFASDKVSSLKLTEQNLAAWFEQEARETILASYCAATKQQPTTEGAAGKKQQLFISTCGVVLAKLAAPTPDITAGIAEVLLTHLAILGNECSPICHAVRRKLQQRITREEEAEGIASILGVSLDSK